MKTLDEIFKELDNRGIIKTPDDGISDEYDKYNEDSNTKNSK